MTAPDPWQPLPAGQCTVFRDTYSLTLLADGPTPWGYLRLVPVMEPDERRADWLIDDQPVVSLRMTDLRFGRRTLSRADYAVVIDPDHQAELVAGSERGVSALVEVERRGFLRRGDAYIGTQIGDGTWASKAPRNYETYLDAPPTGEPAVTVRDYAVQDATRHSNDRADDWREAHLLGWREGTPLAAVALTHLLFAATNWAVVVSSSVGQAMVEGSRKHHYELRQHLFDDPRRR